MAKISVIIPVYNTEKYLEGCITSLVNQTHTDCEFIFVNDGSSDSSEEIIVSQQKKDKRILLINQKNQGVSAARNAGIAFAKGDYIGFVDADDFVDENYFETLLLAIQSNNCNVVISTISLQSNGKISVQKSNFLKDEPYNKEKIHNELLPEFVKSNALNSVCNKLYLASTVKDIKFPIGIALGEDGFFNMLAFTNSNSILFIEYSRYYYREVIGSATKNILKNDYFQNEVNIYNFEYENYLPFDKNQITKWKSIKFLNNIVDLVHLYFEKNNGLTINKKFEKVNKIVSNKIVTHTVSGNYDEIIANKNFYQKLLLNFIKLKSVLLLYILISYSQFRNKK